MGLHAMAELMIDRTQAQITLHGFESGLDLRELDVALPEHARIFSRQIGAQQVMAIALLRLTEFRFVRGEGEGLRRDLLSGFRHADLDEPKRAPGFLLGRADAQ